MEGLLLKLMGVGNDGRPPHDETPETRLDIAAAVVLMEAARANPEGEPDDPATVMGVMLSSFTFPQRYLTDLMDLSLPGRGAFKGFGMIMEHINRNMSSEERLGVLGRIWTAVYSDERLKRHENYFARRLAGYLEVGDRESDEARERAKKALGG
jgi:uncharacterized tellurite resistance protein B-like protein